MVKRTDGWTDERMDGRTDGRTDGRMDGRTDPYVEMKGRIYKTGEKPHEKTSLSQV